LPPWGIFRHHSKFHESGQLQSWIVSREKIAMRLRFWLGVFLLAVAGLVPGWSSALAGVPVFSDIDLSSRLAGQKEAVMEAGQGLVLRLTAPPDGPFGQKLLVTSDGRQVAALEGGKFEQSLGVKHDAADYWIISEYTGGAHCCAEYHFFGRPGPQQPVSYLGKTEGHNGGPLPVPKALVERGGALFFTDLDNRFDYFHESHAGSMLVNLPERHYQLSPAGVRVNNLPFKAEYLKDAEATEKEIQQNLKKRRGRPAAILKSGFGAGFDTMIFSDELGQLLVKRTLYLLYAREDKRAWESFGRDVARFYKTSRWAPELKDEIQRMLRDSPY
jgi:hypothetical protein